MRRLALALALALGACTSEPPPTVSPPPTASPFASPTPAPEFSAERAFRWTRAIAGIGPREATSLGYRRAARLVRDVLRARGYATEYQRVRVPAGTVDGTPVGAGATLNVVARPAGFDPAEPFTVVGAHLDTVPDTRGANDNASGVAVMLEVARIAAVAPPRMPVVFAAFGAEERRGYPDVHTLGARAFVRRLPDGARLRGALILDMVGAGRDVIVQGGPNRVARAALRMARRLDVPTRANVATIGFSDDRRFRDAGYAAAWLWAGDHPTLHGPGDTIRVIERAELRRVGRVAWATVRSLTRTG